MARTLDINKIRNYTEGMLEEAFELISSVDRELFPGVIEVYEFMAENCRNYYNEFNPQDHTARALVYATSALQLCEAHGMRVAESTKAKLTNNINDLVQFTQNTWYQARDAGQRSGGQALTDQQKDFIHQAAELIAIGGCAVALLGTTVAAITALTIISTSIMASAVAFSPVLMPAGILAVAVTPIIPWITFVTAPAIYSVYNDVCALKAQNPQQNITPQKLYDIATREDHFDKGIKLIDKKLESAISVFANNIEQFVQSGLNKAISAKEMTKSVGQNLSNAVASSKVGKTANKTKDAVQRSASKVKAKFTEVVDSARTNLSSSDRKR